MTDFILPETIDYCAAYSTARTRKLADGQFEAGAAFYFRGVRGRMRTAIAPTRARAKAAAMKAIGCA